METVNLNLAHRWYIGYDLGEVVPDHSSLSKIRERYGLEVFHRFFEHIIELCIQVGLVWGEELYFDSTKVQRIWTKPKRINKQKLIKKPCGKEVCGSNLYSVRQNSFTG